MAITALVSGIIEQEHQQSSSATKKMNLLVDPKINIYPLIKTNIFQLAAWKIPAADETAETKVMSQQAAILVKILDGQEHKLAANRSGKSELAGVQKYRNWPFWCSVIFVSIFSRDIWFRLRIANIECI